MPSSHPSQSTKRLGSLAWLALSTALLGGCSVRHAVAEFANDFKCESGFGSSTETPHRYAVWGCGYSAIYKCSGTDDQKCTLVSEGEDASSTQSTSSDATSSNRQELDESDQSRPGSFTELKVEEKNGETVLHLDLELNDKALLRLSAMSEKRAVVQLKLIRREPDKQADSCSLDWMINGQVLAAPKAVAYRKSSVLSQRVWFERELLAELSSTEQMALRACRKRWTLTRPQVAQVREFMDRFREEQAWQNKPRDGSTGGMLAPSGGWPNWSTPSALPAKVEGPALDGRELFKQLSPSVFLLVATLPNGTSQGSAVAVSSTELVTNCHVVEGALKLTLKQEKQEWPASLVRADPANDRCVLSAADAKLKPVAGMRAYDSLEVGEPAYTLGSPVGLELTLGTGIVSGRRDEQNKHYIQTTAPISPGSSGGGLFDARGNLIGVTTLVLAGRERLNQSLNFAIPADAFYAK